MKSKTTVQDIADALQLSRATVSKVLNNTPGVSEETRQSVLQKARELNYKLVDLPPSKPRARSDRPRNIAFLMHTRPDDLHVGSTIMTQIEQEIRQEGFSLTIHTITQGDLDRLEVPPNLYIDHTAAIICLELFHAEYSAFLCSLDIPVLFIDACSDFHDHKLCCDLLMMENRASVQRMLSTLCVRHSITTMGYVGDWKHCLSFRERFEGFQLAARQSHIQTENYHIIADDAFYSHPGWLLAQLQQMNQLPGLFFCANDVLAHNLLLQLDKLGYQTPKDILVCGFDGIPTINPLISSLTTVRTPSQELGITAAHILMLRMNHPCVMATSTYLDTEILYRSTAPYDIL